MPCPNSGFDEPGGTSEWEKDERVIDGEEPDPDYDKPIDKTRQYDPIVSVPTLVALPEVYSIPDLHKLPTPKKAPVSEVVVDMTPEIVVSDLPNYIPEVSNVPEFHYYGEVRPTTSDSELPLPKHAPIGFLDASPDFVQHASSVMDQLGAITENFHAYADVGGGGTNFVRDRNTGAIYDQLTPGELVKDTTRRANRAFIKGDAAMIGVDIGGDLLDAYNRGLFDHADNALEVAADVISQYPDEILQGFISLGEDILAGDPGAPIRAATSIVGVPSVVRLVDEAATAITGERVSVGSDLLDAVVGQFINPSGSVTFQGLVPRVNVPNIDMSQLFGGMFS